MCVGANICLDISTTTNLDVHTIWYLGLCRLLKYLFKCGLFNLGWNNVCGFCDISIGVKTKNYTAHLTPGKTTLTGTALMFELAKHTNWPEQCNEL